MKAKLTLTINKEIKERAKRYAQRKGISVSKLVEDFLDSVSAREDPIHQLGKNPVKTGNSDTSEEHDRYIYPGNSE